MLKNTLYPIGYNKYHDPDVNALGIVYNIHMENVGILILNTHTSKIHVWSKFTKVYDRGRWGYYISYT